MNYTPSQDTFVNGKVADADDMMNELDTIATSINTSNTEHESKAAQNLKIAKDYTDVEIPKAIATIDGGTF